jgi:galactoside O-acetyltransferase
MTLVNKSLDPWGIYVGVPAKRIKERSKKLLALEKDFHEKLSN